MADIFPESREEEILVSMIDGEEYNKAPESRIEALLLELKEVIEEGGGGGGTTNYNLLQNKPSINSVTLTGDKSSADLGIPTDADLAGKQDVLPVAASGNDVAFNGDIQDGQGNTLSVLAEALTKTASGNPVVISDCAGGKARSLITEIGAIQDLHGYDKPWVGGANNNKWDEQWEVGKYDNDTGETATADDRIRTKNYIPINGDTDYYAKVPGNDIALYIFYYDDSYNHITDASLSHNTFDYKHNEVTHSPSSAKYMRFCTNAAYGTTYGNNIAMNYPATVTTYSSYANICPISGRTAVAVDDTGRNIWDEVWELGRYDTYTGEPLNVDTCIRCKSAIKVNSGLQLYCKFPTINYRRMVIYFYDENDNFLSPRKLLSSNQIITVPANAEFLRFYMTDEYGTTYNNDICINISDASFNGQYVPYAHSSATISLGQTVYGAEINWDTGVMTVKTTKQILNSDLTWVRGGGGSIPTGRAVYYFTEGLTGAKPCGNDDNSNNITMKSNVYNIANKSYNAMRLETGFALGIGGDSNSSTIGCNVSSTDIPDASAFETWLDSNPIEIEYPLATPTTIQLTPEQLEMLKGYNRVSIDNGTITLDYIAKADSIQAEVDVLETTKADNADVVDYIENGNTASRAYTANQFMLWKGDLYKVTTSIASGATITAGTNVSKTTIGAVLTALLNA